MNATPDPGKQSFGYYDVEAVLGQGAMGTVYLARDRRIGRRVALKTIQWSKQQVEDSSTDPNFMARLQREAEICGGLNHPNLVTLYEAGMEEGRISYLAIEYIDGESLQALLKKKGALPLEQSLFILQEVLKGLAFAHSRGVIHRDIKPANILLSAEGAVKIADFGIARPAASTLTRAGMLMGTPHYMAPEQVRGESITAQTDLFSTGVMLFQMITGTRPFNGTDVAEILYNIVNAPPPSIMTLRPDLPPGVAQLMERLMARNPAERSGSAAEALRQVRALGLNTAAEAAPPSAPSLTATTEIDAGPIPRVLPGRLRERVSTRIFWSTAVSLGGLILISILLIAGRIDSSPSAHLPQQKILEFREKRRMLAAAESFYRAGDYEASAREYKAYLRRYPDSPAAVEGLQRAVDAQREITIVDEATVTDTSGKKPSPAAKKKEKEEDWMLQQIRSLRRKISGD